MKKCLIIAFVLSSAVSFAQVQKGDSNIGANFGMLDQNGDEDLLNYSYTYFSLNYQYYISNKVSLGFAPALTSTKVLDQSVISNSSALNFYIDYNFLSANGKVMPYLGLKYTTLVTTTKFEDPLGAAGAFGDFLDLGGIIGTGGGQSFNVELDEIKYRRKIVSLSAGIKFFVTERINIDNNLTIGTITNEEVDLGSLGSAETDGDGTLIQFTIGFGYIIGKRGN